jgi:hypothetical protein
MMLPPENDIRAETGLTTGFWVLRHKSEIVCVATMCFGVQLCFLTTMMGHRKKGCATFLINLLGQFYQDVGVIYSSVAPELMPMFTKSGWIPTSDEKNTDGTTNLAPAYAKDNCLRLGRNAYGGAVGNRISELATLSGCKGAFGLLLSL